MPFSRPTVALFLSIVAGTVLSGIGCNTTRTTDTSRTGVEQLLISNAIDASLDKVDFTSLANAAVFVEEKYVESVDKKYVAGAVRHRVFQAGARVVEKPDEADVVLEIHCGAVGTDRSEGFVGMPAVSVPGPVPIALPDVKLFSQTTQYGTAKIGLIAYDAKTKQALSSGGLTRARSNNSNWSVLGFGPFNSGSLREEIALTKKPHRSDGRLSLNDTALRGGHEQTVAAFPDPPSDSQAGFSNALPASVPMDQSPWNQSTWPPLQRERTSEREPNGPPSR